MKKIIKIGIDEAGRGPLAGPLSLAAVSAVGKLDLDLEPYLFLMGKDKPYKDSKKLTEKRRELVYNALINDENIKYAHVFVSASDIDEKGLSNALFESVTKLLKMMQESLQIKDKNIELLLDGALRAPSTYNWSSHTKGDEKFLEIALASIVAKVERDRYMVSLSKKYQDYGFEKHKGYGTKTHKEAIKEHGKCPEHRESFIHFE